MPHTIISAKNETIVLNSNQAVNDTPSLIDKQINIALTDGAVEWGEFNLVFAAVYQRQHAVATENDTHRYTLCESTAEFVNNKTIGTVRNCQHTLIILGYKILQSLIKNSMEAQQCSVGIGETLETIDRDRGDSVRDNIYQLVGERLVLHQSRRQ